MSADAMFGRHKTPTRTKQYAAGLNAAPGNQWLFSFPNGFGASVIDDGYGGDQGLFEVAVIGPDGDLNYETPITDDVLGYLSREEVADVLDRIEALEVPA